MKSIIDWHREEISKLEKETKEHKEQLKRLEERVNIGRGDIYTLKTKLSIKSNISIIDIEKVVIVNNKHFDNSNNVIVIGLDEEDNFVGGIRVISVDSLDKNIKEYEYIEYLNDYIKQNLHV